MSVRKSVQRDSRVSQECFDEAIRQAHDLITVLTVRRTAWAEGVDFDVDNTRRALGNLEFAHRNIRPLG